ncbi:MAG: hypothetical protein IT365_14545 [Candidatus Hydrogenedentes bacterium]|nr:hypothetical protein [Candidatus Hydrogenedentota bacterium]
MISESKNPRIHELAMELTQLAIQGVNRLHQHLTESGKGIPISQQWTLTMHFLCHYVICADMLNSVSRTHSRERFTDELFGQAIDAYSDAFLDKDWRMRGNDLVRQTISEFYSIHLRLYDISSRDGEVRRGGPDWFGTTILAFGKFGAQHIGESNSPDVATKIVEIRVAQDDAFWQAFQLIEETNPTQHSCRDLSAASNESLGAVLEIHFYQPEDVYIFVETNAPTEDAQIFVELILLASYIIRQVSNLGPGAPSQAIGQLATTLASPSTPLCEGLAALDRPRLVAFTGGPGRKLFTCKLQYSPQHVGFSLRAEGFGMLARGVGAYALTSVIALTKHIVEKRSQDDDTIDYVKLCLLMCGEFILQNQVGLKNHDTLVRRIAQALIARN